MVRDSFARFVRFGQAIAVTMKDRTRMLRFPKTLALSDSFKRSSFQGAEH
jgi:hypothetical protein